MSEEDAIAFVVERHAGQVYGPKSYVDGHLSQVVRILRTYGFAEPAIVTAGWLHDVVEDTPTTIDEVKEKFGVEVAHLVWAVTTQPGKNRKERNAATYPKIRFGGSKAVALKLCDRIANVEAAWTSRDHKLFMYQHEYRDFRNTLRRGTDGPAVIALWDHLDRLLGWWEPPQ